MSNWYDKLTSTIKSGLQNMGYAPADDSPTAVYGRIYAEKDPYKQQQMYNAYSILKNEKSSRYYRPYAQPTNQSIKNLQQYGFDINNLTNGWLDTPDAQAYIRSNLEYRSGSGNTPSAPIKSSTRDNRIAYELNQYLISEDNTKKAEKEYQDAIKEAQYWANAKDKNYSDRDIVNKIRENFSTKYPTLAKMETSGNTLFELNRAVDFSDDVLYGAIWQARNPTYEGNIEGAMANWYLGTGKRWQGDSDISAKLNAGSNKYSPYSVGSTMDAERSYFGVDSFDEKWIEDNRTRIVTGNDATAKKYFNNICNAVKYTNTLKTELNDMMTDIDEWLASETDPQYIIDAIRSNSAYKDLFALDDTFVSTDLKATSSAVNYKWADIEKYIRIGCENNKGKKRTQDVINSIMQPLEESNPMAVGTVVGGVVKSGIDYPRTFNQSNLQTPTDLAPDEWHHDTFEYEEETPKTTQVGSAGDFHSKFNTVGNKQDFGLGTIDLNNRPVIHNDDGTISTERSISFYDEDTGKEILIPTVVDGKILTDEEAIQHYYDTVEAGNPEYLGTFDSPEAANQYAEELHERQNQYYNSLPDSITSPSVTDNRNRIRVNTFSDTDIALDEATREAYQGIAYTVKDIGTNAEKVSVITGDTILRDASIGVLKGMETTVKDFASMAKTDAFVKFEKEYADNYTAIRNYETSQADLEDKQAQLETILPEYYQLDKDMLAYNSVQALNYSEFDTLMSYANLSSGENQHWDDVKNAMHDFDKGSRTYNRAAISLYQMVTGVNPQNNGLTEEEAVEKASLWMSYIDSGKSITMEDAERYNELSRWKSTLESEIRQAKDYVESHGNDYNNAKKNNAFTEMMYEAATKMDGTLNPALFKQVEYVYDTASKDVTYQYAGYYGYDVDVQKGKMTVEEAATSAYNDALNVNNFCDGLEEVYKDLLNQGVNLGNRKSVQNSIDSLRDYAAYSAYAALDGNKDFNSVVSNVLSNRKLASSNIMDGYIESVAAGNKRPTIDIIGSMPESIESINQQEAQRYIYIRETEGAEKAKEYIDFLCDPDKGMLTVRSMTELQQNLYEFASDPNSPNAFLATPAAVIMSLATWEQPLSYKIKQNILGEDVSPYNMAFGLQIAHDALIRGSKDVVTKAYKELGAPQIVTDMMGKVYDIGVGGAELTLGASTAQWFFGSIGVDLNNLASGLASPTLSAKIAKSAAEVIIPTLNSANQKYRERLFVTNNEEALEGMYAVDFAAGLTTHAVIMSGLHADFEANGKEVTSMMSDFFQKILRTDAAVGTSTFATGALETLADKALMGANSNWQKNVNKFHDEYHYPLAVAEQMADQQMWADVNQQMWGAIMSSTIRTGLLTAMSDFTSRGGFKALGQELMKTASSAKNAAIRGLNQLVPEKGEAITYDATDSVILDANGNPVATPVSGYLSGEAPVAEPEVTEPAVTLALPEGTSDAKTMQTVMSMYNVAPSAATTGVISILNTGNDIADTAAGEIIVGDLAYGDSRTVSMVLGQVYQTPYDNQEINNAIVDASLTNGEGNATLKDMFEKTNLGQPITQDDVRALINGVNNDRSADPTAFDKAKRDAITERRVADETVRIASNNSVIKNSKALLKKAQESKAEAEKSLQAAEDQRDAVIQNAQDSIATLVEDGQKASVGPVQQTTNQADGADKAVSEAEKAVEIQTNKVAEADQNLKDTQNSVMAEARQQAQETVSQQIQQEEEAAAKQAQAEFEAALATYTPSVPFKSPIVANLKNGNSTQFLGGYAKTPDGQIVWATTNGYVTDDEIDWENTVSGSDYSQTAIDKVLNNFASNNTKNPVTPAVWFGHSLSADVIDGDTNISLVGLSGQTPDGDLVFIDKDGNEYPDYNLAFNADPFTGENGLSSQFHATENVDYENLPVISREELFRREHPEINLPERFVQYPNGPVTVKDQAGNDQIIIGIDANYNSGEPLFYVLDDGNEIPAYAIAEEPSDFTAWWMNEVGEQALPEEGQQDDITALVSSEALGYNGFKAPEGTIGYDLNNEEVTILGLYDYDGDLAYLVQREGMEPEFIEESKILPIKNHKWAMKAIDEIETKIDQQFALSTDESVMPSDKPTGITYGDWSSPYGIKTNTIYPENFKSCEVTTGEGDGEYPVKLEGIYVTNTGDIVFTSENGPMWVEDINPVSENAADFFNWAIDVAKNELANPERGNSSTQDNINNFITSINNLLTGDTKTELVSDTLVNGNETLMGYSAPEGVKALLFGSTVNVKGMYKDSHGKYYLKMDTPGNNIIPWSEATILPDSDPTRWAQTAYAELDNTSGSVISTSPETPSFGQPTTVVLPNGDDAKGYEAPHPMPAKTVAGFDVTVKGVYKSGNKYVYDVGSGFAGYNNISLTNADDALWAYKAVTAIDNGGSQNQSVSLQNEDNSILNATTLNKTKEVTEADGTTHTLKLKDWQNEKFHGPVKQAIKKENPKSKKFKEWQNLEGMEVYDSQGNKLPLEKYEKYFNDSQGAKKYYRGYGDFGHNLYVTHESKGGTSHDGTPYSVNFYMDKFSTASSYAGTNKVVQLRYIQNWETAKEAMKDIGLDLVETVQSGTPGYLVVKPLANGQVMPSDTKSGNFFKENELAKFRNTYGGNPKHKGIHVGYLTGNKVLVIDGLHSGYYEVAADVTLPNGLHLQDIDKTRNWAKWVFKNSDVDTIIFDQVQDNVSGGGEFGVEIVTRYSPQFKSIWNKGSYSSTNPNILAMKTYPSNAKAYKEKLNGPTTFKATGEPLSAGFENFRYDLENGKDLEDMTPEEKKAIVENFKKTPEYRYANAHTTDESTLPWSMTTAIRMFDGSANSIKGLEAAGVPEETINMLLDGATYSEAVESLFTPEDVSEIYRIRDLMATENGSPVLDSNGEISSYTGPVAHDKQLHLIIGMPGSGKSTLANPLAQQEQARILDPDIAKTEHRKNMEGGNDGLLHNESRYITSLARNIMVENGDNVVYPIVGSNYGSVIRDIQDFRDAGYDITVHRVDIPWNKSVLRAVNRLAEKNRNVDIEYLTGESDAGISPVRIKENFNKLIEEGIANGGYAVWNNDVERGEPPIPTEYSDEKAVSITGGAFGNSEGYSEGNGGRGANGISEQPSLQALRVTKTPVKKNLTPTDKHASEVKAKLKSPQDILDNLTNELGIGNYRGTSKLGGEGSYTRGYYDSHGKYIAIRKKWLGSPSVGGHEAGHAIFDMLDLTSTPEMVERVQDPEFNTEGIDFSKYPPDKIPREAEAEFIRRYLQSEAAARDFAGDEFYDEFEKQLAMNPKLNAAVTKARDEMRQWIEAETSEQMGSVIKREKSPTRLGLKKIISTLTARAIDRSAPAEEVMNAIREATGEDIDFSENLRGQALLTNNALRRAEVNLTDFLTDTDGTIIGDGLSKRMADYGFEYTENNLEELDKYLLAKVSLERDKRGKAVFDEHITPEAREAYINKIESERPDIVGGAEAYWEFWKDFRQVWMVEEGFLPQKVADEMDQMYEHYAPTIRVMNNIDTASGLSKKGSRKYQLREATGGTQDVFSPFYSMVDMVERITNMALYNKAARTFDELYQKHEGLGEFARPVSSENTELTVDEEELNARQQELLYILQDEIDEDLMEQVLEITKNKPGVKGVSDPNLLTVTRKDGTVVKYQMANKYLYDLLAGVEETDGRHPVWEALGRFTRMMSMLTTGSNPFFALRNATRDIQTSVNYGTWAKTYADAIPKWLKTFVEVANGESEDYKNYLALGGGGWTRMDISNSKGIRDIEHDMFGYDKSNVAKTLKWLGVKATELVTMEKLNEWVEQTSRFVEYKYGKHDLSTPEGRKEAFLASRDVTVDFSRKGAGMEAYVLSKIVPFFNASAQGVYRTGRQFTQAERGNTEKKTNKNNEEKVDYRATAGNAFRSDAARRVGKTVMNMGLVSAVAAGLILKAKDNKDLIEEYNMLDDDIKKNHIILPNPLRHINEGASPFIRIPIAQDPLAYAVNAAVTNAIWKGTTDEWAIEASAVADAILDNINPVSGTIFQPFIDASHHRTYYGGNTIRASQKDWSDATVQYNEDTPEFFKWLSRGLSTFGGNASPEDIEYLFQQYSGFVGQTAIPFFSKKSDGSLGGFGAVGDTFTRQWTADPTRSNDIFGDFYDMASSIDMIQTAAKRDRPENMLRRSLTQDEVNQAYLDAEKLLESNGVIDSTKKMLTEMYAECDKISANPTLTSSEKARLTRQLKLEALRKVDAINDQLLNYYDKYLKDEGIVDHISRVNEGKYAHVPTDFERMDKTFQNDANASYMQRATGVYNGASGKDANGNNLGGGKSAALPHPDKELKINNKKYTITDQEWSKYTSIYKNEYEKSLKKYNDAQWNRMSDYDKYRALQNAHTAANKAMRERYAKDHGIKTK